MTVFLFPGQGSQFLGMKNFIHEKKLALVEKFFDLEKIFLSEEILNQTQHAQVMIFLHSISIFEDFKKDFDMALGHSLGEYSALYACGVWSFETALKIVLERGRLMSECQKGSMWVILTQEDLSEYKELKNNNAPDQWIFSGLEKDFEGLKEKILTQFSKIKIVSLKVSGAFHSLYMNEIAQKFKLFLNQQNFLSLKKPFVSNVTAEVIYEISKENLIELLTRQLSESVLWKQSLEKLQAIDVCYELGPGKTLQGLMKKNRPEIKVSSFQSKEDFLS